MRPTAAQEPRHDPRRSAHRPLGIARRGPCRRAPGRQRPAGRAGPIAAHRRRCSADGQRQHGRTACRPHHDGTGGRWTSPGPCRGRAHRRPCRAGNLGEAIMSRLHCAAMASAAARRPHPAVTQVLRTSGRPLAPGTRGFFESRLPRDIGPIHSDANAAPSESALEAAERQADQMAAHVTGAAPSGPAATGLAGHDVGRVRIHTDAQAAASARAVGALAYTVGEHIVFGAGQYQQGSAAGRRRLAHELAPTVQPRGGTRWLARQCDPAWAGPPWSQRVQNAKAAAPATGNGCIADMLKEALPGTVTVHEATNTQPNVSAAINTGKYTEWGTLSDTHVNFDRNLNAKIGGSEYGYTTFRTSSATPHEIRIYIQLGPNALNEIGPQFTQMAFEHESAHAWDYLRDWAMQGSKPHSATPGEELAIYAEGFSRHFLDMCNINNQAPGSFQIADSFSPLLRNFAASAPAEQNAAFDSIRLFYQVRIQDRKS